jgi:PKD repeat protein
MKKKLIIYLAIFFLTAGLRAQTAFPGFVDGKIYFKVQNTSGVVLSPYNGGEVYPDATLLALFHTYSVTKLSRPFINAASADLTNTYKIEFSSYTSAISFISDLKAISYVEYAERAVMPHVTSNPPSDFNVLTQPNLAQVKAQGGWNIFPGAATPNKSNVIIAVVDNEFYIDPKHGIYHQEFVNGGNSNLWVNTREIPNNGKDDDGNGYIDDVNGFDVGNNDPNMLNTLLNPNPPNNHSHGTHVAGMAAALTDVGNNTSPAIASISWNPRLMAVKASTDASPVYLTNAEDGVYYAIVNHADIISLSWGSSSYSQTQANVIQYALNNGIIVVAAAGNDGQNAPHYPAALPGVIAVGAVDGADKIAWFSNYGSFIDVMAPGVQIWSSTGYGTNTYDHFDGTSMATPQVSALCALMKSYNPNLTAAEVKSCLENGCDNIDLQNSGYSGLLGHGRINVQRSLQCIQSTPPVVAFSASNTQGCAGCNSQITLYDNSGGAPGTSWNWVINPAGASFQNGTTAQSKNPVVCFPAAGQYSVSLTVTNVAGTNTFTQNNYLNIAACIANHSTQSFWQFGSGAGLNFSSGTPVGISSSNGSIEACASISDANGNLLFYTNGIQIWNKNNVEVTSPTSYLKGSWNSNPGNLSSTCQWGTKSMASASQGVLIVPMPGSTTKYYIFTVSDVGVLNLGLSYTIFDMSLNSGFGGISGTPNIVVGGTSNFTTTEELTAVPHCNGTDYWILVHGCGGTNDANILSFQLSAAGLNATPVISPSFAALNSQEQGMLKASRNGTFVTAVQRNGGNGNTHAVVYTFDQSTGICTPYTTFSNCDYACSYSPSEKYLYTYSGQNIVRFDLNNLSSTPEFIINTHYSNFAGSMEMGPDDKIYFSTNSPYQLGVIPFPDNIIHGANLSGPALATGTIQEIGLPNMIDAKAKVNPPPTFTYATNPQNCLSIAFTAHACASSYTWNFGDGIIVNGSGSPVNDPSGTTTGSYSSPTHTFTSGQFLVTLTINGQSVSQLITIGNPCTAAIVFNSPTTINSSTSWGNTTVAINADITIPNGVTLNVKNSDIVVSSGHTIIVQKGGLLMISSTHMHACLGNVVCNPMWHGIEVACGGILDIFNYSIIEDALSAVYTDPSSGSTDVPFINCHNAIFNKNQSSILIGSNPNDVNVGQNYIINSCIFTCRIIPTVCTAANFASIQAALTSTPVPGLPTTTVLSGSRSVCGIYVESQTNPISYKVGIVGSGLANIFDNLDMGLGVYNSYATIQNCQFYNMTGNVSPANNNGGGATGIAIYATISRIRTLPGGSLVIGGTYANSGSNIFKNCFRAMDINGYDYLTIDNNTIDNNQTDISFTNNQPLTGQYGIFVKPSGYSSASAIHINNNTINNCANAIHVNRSIGYLGSQIRIACNTISAAGNTTGGSTQYCTIGVHLQDASGNSSTMAAKSIQIYSNAISVTEKYGVLCENISHGLDIDNNTNIALHSSPNTGITVANAGLSGTSDDIRLNYCSNTIVANNSNVASTNPPSYTNEGLTGIYVNGGTSNNIQNNYINQTGACLVFNASGGTGTNYIVQNNFLGYSIKGLYLLNGAILGTQGSAGNPSGNRFGTYPGIISGAQTYSLNPVSSNVNVYSKLWVNSGACNSIYCTNPTTNTGTNPYLLNTGLNATTGSDPANPICATCACSNNQRVGVTTVEGNHQTEELSKLISAESFSSQLNEVIKSDESNPEFKWRNLKAAFDIIHANKDLYSKDAMLGEFYNDQYNSTIGLLTRVDEYLSLGEFDKALSLNNSVSPTNLIEQNLYTVNRILLRKLNDEHYAYTLSDKQEMSEIANSCAYTNGPAVYRARALYDAMCNQAMTYMDNCKIAAPETVPEIHNAPSTSATLHIFPNPNKGEMTVNYSISGDENAMLCIFDLNGKQVAGYLLKADATSLEISNENLSNGVYMYKVISKESILNTGRLVIIK